MYLLKDTKSKSFNIYYEECLRQEVIVADLLGIRTSRDFLETIEIFISFVTCHTMPILHINTQTRPQASLLSISLRSRRTDHLQSQRRIFLGHMHLDELHAPKSLKALILQ
jgi:hypothetical protein